MAKTCKGCKYWRPLTTTSGAPNCCCYCLITGRLRGGKAEDCTVREIGKRAKMKKSSTPKMCY